MADKKEFQKKFMHPTRRKLVDMIHTGEYDSTLSFGYEKKEEVRNIGDVWEDEHHKYEKHNGFTIKQSKNSDAFQEIRDYITETKRCKNNDCKRKVSTRADKTLIKKTGYCVDCLAEIETKIKASGVWEEYQNYRIWTRMLVDGKIRLEKIQQAHDELKQYHEYVNEDGTTERWTLPQPVDELKLEMKTFIEDGKKEIEELEIKRQEAFKTLAENNYEHYL